MPGFKTGSAKAVAAARACQALTDVRAQRTCSGSLGGKHYVSSSTSFGSSNPPISVVIETELQGDRWNGALEQLSTWTGAQIIKLNELLLLSEKQHAAIPPLPLLKVQGHDWNLGILEHAGPETVRCHPGFDRLQTLTSCAAVLEQDLLRINCFALWIRQACLGSSLAY